VADAGLHVMALHVGPQAAAKLVVAPILRGACSAKDERGEGAWRRLILDFRATPDILNFVNGAELARYSQAGVVTPDHTIRTKNWPLVLRAASISRRLGCEPACRCRSTRR
jgi:rhamnose utilization protein RhaD (predicted bifunctional aldolase and dehydrogenase)